MEAPSTPNAAAAHWWADQLRHVTRQDNGDRSSQGAFVYMMAAMVKLPAPDAVGKFEAALLASLNDNPQRILACDYGAEGALGDAAISVGIRPTCGPFPMKTVMWIDKDTVKVRHGYGRPVEQVYPAPTTNN